MGRPDLTFSGINKALDVIRGQEGSTFRDNCTYGRCPGRMVTVDMGSNTIKEQQPFGQEPTASHSSVHNERLFSFKK